MNCDLRFWAELISPGELTDRALPLLREFGAGVAVAMYPVSLTRENAVALRELKGAGVEVTLWPLMEQDQGYFPGEGNVEEYSAMVRNLIDWARRNEVLPGLLAVDLEPPIEQLNEVFAATGGLAKLRGAFNAARRNLDRERYYKAKAVLDGLNGWVQAQGVRTLAAVMPWVALELEGDHELIQDMNETPVAGISWDLISPMLYVTMLGGMAERALNRRDANWLLYETCLKLRERYAGRAGVSLGLTGRGVLEDEPTFDDPGELVVGLEAALAAGVRDVSIYSLEGVLARDDPRPWLEAIRSAQPRVPERSEKVARGLSAVRLIYPALARLADWYRRPP
jgi:hypothetical protein